LKVGKNESRENGPTARRGNGIHAGAAGPGLNGKKKAEQEALQNRMRRIEHQVIVMSGKGGVGKSMVAVNLAVFLARAGYRVGLLDIDIHGPSVPVMLGLEGETIRTYGESILPVEAGSLSIMSIGFLLRDRGNAVIWRGPMKMSMIKKFLLNVDWGDLDYLVIDAPPGTGDEPLSVCQLIKNLDGALIVTTPQETATVDVRKSISFCRRLNLDVIGVIENMSGFLCRNCGKVTEIFSAGGGERMAREMEVPFLGRVPIDPEITRSGDEGVPFLQRHGEAAAAAVLERIFQAAFEHSGIDATIGSVSA